MSAFTEGVRASPYSRNVTCVIILDEKGRILLPSVVRKNFGLGKGVGITLTFSLDKNVITLVPMVTQFSTKEKEAPYG